MATSEPLDFGSPSENPEEYRKRKTLILSDEEQAFAAEVFATSLGLVNDNVYEGYEEEEGWFCIRDENAFRIDAPRPPNFFKKIANNIEYKAFKGKVTAVAAAGAAASSIGVSLKMLGYATLKLLKLKDSRGLKSVKKSVKKILH
jgi:hypothetical protein